jgi:hypothetical protein
MGPQHNPGTSEFISDMGFLKISPSADGQGISPKCKRNPGFLPERGFLVRIIHGGDVSMIGSAISVCLLADGFSSARNPEEE